MANPVALLLLRIRCILPVATMLPKLEFPSHLPDQVSTHLTMGTLRQILPHPYHLLPIIKLQFSLLLQENHIHSSKRWKKSDVSSMHTISDDDTQPALRRLMVTEVDRRGHHHNRQPEYFFNGIIGHILAGQNGWIDSWDQSSQLANYWRRYFQIPEISPYGHWRPHQDEVPGSPESLQESVMDDTDSLIANVDINPPPVQIHQLATFLWNILNNDREANMAILERLEDTEGDLSRHPVQIFSAADLAHLASHLAESTRTLSNQARRMEALPDEGL